ncbi:MAG: hypothetical protein L3J73_02770 [Thermoplasmata archaeon]|nr:hypothetical protein [Thermoplasmata archaeon]
MRSLIPLALLLLSACSIGLGTKETPPVSVSRSALLDAPSVLGALYHSDFDAEHGVTYDGSGHVSAWANQGGHGDAATGSQASADPLYSATSFFGAPGITSAEQTQMTATLSAIPSGNRPYMWIVLGNAVTSSSYVLYYASLHDAGFVDEWEYIEYASELSPAAYVRTFYDLRTDSEGASETWACQGSGMFTDEGMTDCDPSSTRFDGGKHLVEVGFTENGTATLVVDGVGHESPYPTGGAASADLVELTIFGAPASSIGLTATVARVIVASDQPSSQQIADMRSGLSDKYALGL